MLDFCAEHGIVSDVEVIAIAADQRGVRADAQERREVSIRDRSGDARVVGQPIAEIAREGHCGRGGS